MIINQEIINNLNKEDLALVPTKRLVRKFGKKEDNVELYIYDLNDNLLLYREDFRKFRPQRDINDPDGLYNEINIDYTQTLKELGFNSGQYRLVIGFYRKLIVDSLVKPFYISEISKSRREIKIKSDSLTDENVIQGFNKLIGILSGQAYFREILLNFGRNRKSTAINFAIDSISEPTEVLIKLYEPLPNDIREKSKFRLSEEIIHPIALTIDLGDPSLEELIVGEQIKGPNLRIDTRLNSSKPSTFQNFDQLLGGAASSSFQNIDNYLSSSFELAIDFTNTNTPTRYHFENFIHFSSAVERLKNFNYKLGLIENYDEELNEIDTLSGPHTSSINVINERSAIENKKRSLIGGFDAYERFLYYESGTFAWPKTNSARPYTLSLTTSPEAQDWLGSEDYNNSKYGGQLLSGSEYDDLNIHRLTDTLPEHIVSNNDNDQYTLFVNMVGEHFDKIWIYIDHLTKINKAENKLTKGISKDLVYDVLERAGLKVFDQFENENLFSYLNGDFAANGNFQYQAPVSQSMVSASNAGSIPKGDITKEVWKRLYHNLPYLLKTKGTERGMKALISSYGIPESILHIKEYGGPTVDKTGFRTFSYQKKSNLTRNSPGVASPKIIEHVNFPTASKTLQVRFLASQSSFQNTSYDLVTFINCSGSAFTGKNDFSVGVSQSIDPSNLGSGSLAHLIIASGSRATGIVTTASSSLGPIFNGDVWNLSIRLNSGSTEGNTVEAFATNTTANKNTYVLSCSLDITNYFEEITGSNIVYAGYERPAGVNVLSSLIGPFTGSMQEYRVWTEKLNTSTIVTQSLSPFNYNGNNVSSSFNSLIVRIPLGSDNNPVTHNVAINNAPNKTNRLLFSATPGIGTAGNHTVHLEETHHLTTPDTVGKSMVSDKIRVDSGSIEDNILSPFIRSEESTQDRQPNDFSDLGVFFSPTFEVNEDIIYTLGGFRMDDYIGDPRHYVSSSYPDLESLRDIYIQKIENRIINIFDYLKLIQQFDHTLFKMIEQFAPAKANLKTGLVIEPHYLQRDKLKGTTITLENKSYLANVSGNLNPPISAEYLLNEATIDIHDIILTGSIGDLENNVLYGKRSDKFFVRVTPYNQIYNDVITDNNDNSVLDFDQEGYFNRD